VSELINQTRMDESLMSGRAPEQQSGRAPNWPSSRERQCATAGELRNEHQRGEEQAVRAKSAVRENAGAEWSSAKAVDRQNGGANT
jgi:hypothetical protein